MGNKTNYLHFEIPSNENQNENDNQNVNQISNSKDNFQKFLQSIEVANLILKKIRSAKNEFFKVSVNIGKETPLIWRLTIRVTVEKFNFSGICEDSKQLNFFQTCHLLKLLPRESYCLFNELTVSKKKENLDLNEQECVICFNCQIELIQDCGHAFCKQCLIQWRKEKTTCPLCRNDSHNNQVDDCWELIESSKINFEEHIFQLIDNYLCNSINSSI
eukprot:TRINITY_DN363_c1_g2_i1.p1 TRINITY_DN363_c1_g2~~TRINITY_DN363_c1_g2_i1.p1  ORF type:complete len:217 (-),score=61.68 TRINITY_DN363_c1_g2_i1:78-728(-)